MKTLIILLILGLHFQPAIAGITVGMPLFSIHVQSRDLNPTEQHQLKDILQQLTDHYHVDILFLDRTVAGLTVTANMIRLDRSLEQNLEAVLRPVGLFFKKTRNGSYAILSKQAASNRPAPIKAIITPELPATHIPNRMRQVWGTVRDAQGSVLPNVHITFFKHNNGTTTDSNGQFKLLANEGATLIFSCVGYVSRRMQVDRNGEISLVLETDVHKLTEVSVIGSRSKVIRTKTDTPEAVDVIGAGELNQTGQTDLTQMINYIAPSFSSARQTISNGTDFIDPASLRGLGPDQVLVLINGKRRHTSALVNVNSTVGRGSVGTDLNALPQGAIERIEILRDGAAAQYGSDAIAGVINVVLKKNTRSGSWLSQAGVTHRGDGKTVLTSLNYGLGLGKRSGFVNLTLAASHRDPTNRTGYYNNTVYLPALPPTRFLQTTDYVPLTAAQLISQQQDNVLVEERNFDRKGMLVGNSRLSNYACFFNMVLPLTKFLELYAFGGISQRYGRSPGFYRYPNNSRTNNLDLYPNGYLPFIDAAISDQSFTAGFRRVVPKGWTTDFSNSYGGNSIRFNVSNSLNASLGNNSPTSFYCGQMFFRQNTTNLLFSKGIHNLGFTRFFNMAFGAEFRVDTYGIRQGQIESWQNYNAPDAQPTQIKASGAQVFSGFNPENETNKNRANMGIFADIETDLTKKMLLSAAIRYENYNDFGANLSGKVVARYKVTDVIALRGGVNRGFRAPSLQQRYFSAASTQFITVDGVNQQREVTTVRNDASIVRQLGIPDLKSEKAWCYSLGLTAALRSKLVLTVDAYHIAIQDRIVISGRFSNTVPQLAQFFSNTGLSEAQFFTNAIDTKTNGLDAILTYHKRIDDHPITVNAALNVNKTTIVGGGAGVRTPTQLTGLGETLLNREERGRIEVNLPHHKLILSGNYQPGSFNIRVAATHFGKISTIAPQDPLQDQTFSAKWVTDLSVGYRFRKVATLMFGANNLFNIYPDKVADPRLTNDGTVVYSRFATQFGFNGACYFTTLTLTL